MLDREASIATGIAHDTCARCGGDLPATRTQRQRLFCSMKCGNAARTARRNARKRASVSEAAIVRQSIAEADERAIYAGPGWWKETPAYLAEAKRRYDTERRLRDEQFKAQEVAIEREVLRLRVSRPNDHIVVVDGIVRSADMISLVFGLPRPCSRIG